MKSIAIKSSARTELGRKSSRIMRRSGTVPCVLYGGQEVIHFAAPEMEFKHLVYTPNVYTVDLNVDGKEYKAVLRDIQFHPVTDRIVHIDFMELVPGKKVTMDIPVHVNGTAIGVREGGVLINKLRKLKVKSLPEHLPDAVEVNIEALSIGKAIRVADISIPEVEFLDAPNNIITAVKTARAVVEETPAAAAEGAAAPAADAAAAPAADAKKDEKAPAAKK